MDTQHVDIRHFRNPPKEYREVPFWSWNDDLDPEELGRQIGLMDDAGWGGFFMHARVGLQTPYLGERWMDCISACVDEARQRGMDAWLYDEDKWPSGFAGGLSVSQDADYRPQYLVCKVDNRPALLPERIATFAAREVNGVLSAIWPEHAPKIATDNDRLIQFYPQTQAHGVPWFNDYCYANLLNPDAVRAFLDTTHEVYARILGADFGGAVPGIFTDEPCHSWRAPRPDVPGHPLGARLPRLLPEAGLRPAAAPAGAAFDVDDYQAVRYDYWRTVTELFVKATSRR